MFYTIGEAAKMLGVAPSALRYYDKEGLLPFVERTGSGIRMFKESDMEWLRLIECLKATGMPIKDIRRFIQCTIEGDGTIDQRLEILTTQRQSVINQIAKLNEHLELIDYKIWYYNTAKDAGTATVMNDYPLDNVPEKFKKFRK